MLAATLIVALAALSGGAKAGVPEEIRHYFDEFEAAFKAQNAPNMANFFTENTVFVSNSTVFVGRKAIVDFWSGVFKDGFKYIRFSLDAVEPHGKAKADWALAVGTFQADSSRLLESGPFSKLLRKENGRWLSDLHRCTVYHHQ